MYCKFCGSRIDSNTVKCLTCGANIDFTDGGQSFFDDNELDAWQDDSVLNSPRTAVPRTEMREGELFFDAISDSVNSPQKSYRRFVGKKKKNVLGYFNLSSSNKLIIFCIASALAIVLLVVAIIAVLNGGGSDTGNENVQTNYNEAVNDKTVKNDVSVQNINKEKVENVKIVLDGKEVEHKVPCFMVDNKIYVSIDQILKYEGYKRGVADKENEKKVIYAHSQSSKSIEIEKGSNKIWISDTTENPEVQHLEGDNFNEGTDTYVPAKNFLTMIGYLNINYDIETKTLTADKK